MSEDAKAPELPVIERRKILETKVREAIWKDVEAELLKDDHKFKAVVIIISENSFRVTWA